MRYSTHTDVVKLIKGNQRLEKNDKGNVLGDEKIRAEMRFLERL